MPKLTVITGLPFSGKTTKSWKILEDETLAVRISRKELKDSITSSKKASDLNGHIVDQGMVHLIKYYLSIGISVVMDVDDMNPMLVEKMKLLATSKKFEFKHVQVNTSMNTCITRAQKSTSPAKHRVPEIVNAALKWGKYPKPKRLFVIYMLPRFNKIKSDVKKSIDNLVKFATEGYDIILVSTEHESKRDATNRKLAEAGIFAHRLPINTLLMNGRENDTRANDEIVESILNEYIKNRKLIHKII